MSRVEASREKGIIVAATWLLISVGEERFKVGNGLSLIADAEAPVARIYAFLATRSKKCPLSGWM
jgi:hypothetical protein